MSDQPQSGVPSDVAQKYDEELVNPPPQTESAPVSAAELKAGAAERAKNRPLLQKILAVFQKEKGCSLSAGNSAQAVVVKSRRR